MTDLKLGKGRGDSDNDSPMPCLVEATDGCNWAEKLKSNVTAVA